MALAIGAGEPQVSKALLGLAAEGYLEKVEVGKYRAAGMAELGQAEFLKAFARASRVDSTRQRDLSEIARLKQNNDTMRQRLLATIAERDHYLAALKKHGIDPGRPPAAAARPPRRRLPRRAPSASGEPSPGPQGLAVPSPASESAPSGPGDAGSHHARAVRPTTRASRLPCASRSSGTLRPATTPPRRIARADRHRGGPTRAGSAGRSPGRGVRFSLVVTSPLVRAVQTAEIVAAAVEYRRT